MSEQYARRAAKIDAAHYVTVQEMAEAREHRASVQREMLERCAGALVSFTLNIAGPVKRFPLAERTFREGVRLIKKRLPASGFPVLAFREELADTGCEAFFSVDGEPESVKEEMCLLEEQLTAGRLLDIDVIRPDGRKVSRTEVGFPERKCLICGKDAFICGRARSHPAEELFEKSCSIMRAWLAEENAKRLSLFAIRALLYEVSTTPKPGLVDRHNNGAHRDMDIFTFEASAVALAPYFERFARCGAETPDDPRPAEAPAGGTRGTETPASGACGTLFRRLRTLGAEAEEDMLRATGGVNTHKGLIFSLAFFLGAIGRLLRDSESCSEADVSDTIREMASGLPGELSGLTAENASTSGERIYLEHGVRGARGEAISGYGVIFREALPVLRAALEAGAGINDAGVITLLHIIAGTEDSNIIRRSSYGELQSIRARIREILDRETPESGGGSADGGRPDAVCQDAARVAGLVRFAEELDREFIERNISPGGSADLLALAWFVLLCEKEGIVHA